MLNNTILNSAGDIMPRLTAAPISLTEKQRTLLQGTVRKHTSPQNLVTRCRIILLADEGISVHETMRQLKIGRTTVQNWRKRRLQNSEQENPLARLQDAPRSGAPAIYTAEQICSIIAIACERPEDSQRPITHWTQQEIADEAIKRGIVDYISQRSVGRFLKRSGPATPPDERLVDGKKR